MTCLYIIALSITQCLSVPAPQTAVCHPVGGETQYCTVETLPAYLSWYDGALCDESPINCYEDTGDYLGDGTPTAESYGWAMACPWGLYGAWVTFDGVGRFQCRDHGTAVTIRYGERYTSSWGWWEGWHVVFDLSMQNDEFPHAYDVVKILLVERE